jgi:hypothetical protein
MNFVSNSSVFVSCQSSKGRVLIVESLLDRLILSQLMCLKQWRVKSSTALPDGEWNIWPVYFCLWLGRIITLQAKRSIIFVTSLQYILL